MLAKVRGWQCRWPVSVWSLKLCLRKDMEQILESHKPGGPISTSKLISVGHAPAPGLMSGVGPVQLVVLMEMVKVFSSMQDARACLPRRSAKRQDVS